MDDKLFYELMKGPCELAAFAPSDNKKFISDYVPIEQKPIKI